MPTQLQQRIDFIKSIDALKEVQRQTYLMSESRLENSAEHSWAVATCALTFTDYAPAGTDINRVIHMLLLHDIVEVDAGDALLYDEAARKAKAVQEIAAADRIFSQLPTGQAHHFRSLWDEFEAELTQEAQFAAALDRLIPLLHNLETQGRAWQENQVNYQMVVEKNKKIARSSPELWEYIHARLLDAVSDGWLSNI